MFEGLKNSLSGFSKKAREIVQEKEINLEEIEPVLEEFKVQLIKNNVAFDVSEQIIESLKKELSGKVVKRKKVREFLEVSLRKILREILELEKIEVEELVEKNKPALILFMGFNGCGKTTTIAKFAYKFKGKFKIVLAAGDTFRAASIEQLEEHAEKLNLRLIKQEYGSDSAAVIYDSRKYAEKSGIDLILADSAGRSHTNKNLMEELKKIIRVNNPTLKVLVVDSLVGNDVLNQINFYRDVGFDCTILTKTDIDRRGGTILNLAYLTKKPILYLGNGQDYEKLEEFSAEKILDRLF